jgi:KDO2-lipid IV(A) lauroyltransferase
VLRNLHQVLPQASPAELRRVARGVWGNLGAVLFEYPHVEHIAKARVQVTMAPAVRALFDAQRPILVLSAHLANWEVLASFLGRRGNGIVVVYSPNDNPVMERIIQRFRASSGCEYVTKQEALRRLTARFLHGRSVGLLADVRVDSGPVLPLFGAGAPTTISPARLAARLAYPLVPARVKRLGQARFEIEFEEPLVAAAEHIGKRAAADLMCQFNARLEDWIAERPDEWLCTKRRWPKDPQER